MPSSIVVAPASRNAKQICLILRLTVTNSSASNSAHAASPAIMTAKAGASGETPRAPIPGQQGQARGDQHGDPEGDRFGVGLKHDCAVFSSARLGSACLGLQRRACHVRRQLTFRVALLSMPCHGGHPDPGLSGSQRPRGAAGSSPGFPSHPCERHHSCERGCRLSHRSHRAVLRPRSLVHAIKGGHNRRGDPRARRDRLDYIQHGRFFARGLARRNRSG